MTIEAADIKLLESERMTDTTDGGGRRTSNVIPDGVAGNIFPKVSRLDSVYGRVNLRKVFGHVDSANVDIYAGAHAVLLDAPDNDRIHVNIFSTGSDFDDRTAARDRIESYVVSGPESRMVLYGRQLVGQQAITVIQRTEDPLPEVGEVFCLSTETGGVVGNQQYVRASNISHETRTFTDANGDFQRRVVTIATDSPLRYEFTGWEQASRISATPRSSLVRTTTVADAARYFGIQPLTGGVLAEALELNVANIFSPIVPTTQRETAVSNAKIGGALPVVPMAPAPLALYAITGAMTNTQNEPNNQKTTTVNLGVGVVPGTFQIVIVTASNPVEQGNIATDDSQGVIPDQVTQGPFGYRINGGVIDYESGVVTVSWHGQGRGDIKLYASYVPGAAASQPAHVIAKEVTLATRGTVHVVPLWPLPAKGTAFIDFRAQGKWYRLRDNGKGELGGDDQAYGTGTVDYVTGNLVVTLGALPDVGSEVIFGWGSPAHYRMLVGGTADSDTVMRQSFTLLSLPVKPATLTIKYTAGVTEYTAVADVNGAISGGGVTGTVNHATGEVSIAYSTRLPNKGTGLSVSYSQETPTTAEPTSDSGTGVIASFSSPTFDTRANVATKGLRVMVPIFVQPYAGFEGALLKWPAHDDGSGNLVMLAHTQGGWSAAGGETVGSVDYATGVVTINPAAVITLNRPYWNGTYTPVGGGTWTPNSDFSHSPAVGDYQWTIRLTNASNASPVAVTVSQDTAALTLDLTTTLVAQLVPGTLSFTAFGRTYYDLNGVLYHSRNVADGTGTVAGSVDYVSGKVTISDYVENTAFALTMLSGLAKYGEFSVAAASFRTAGSPLRPSATFIQVVAEDGETITATCDSSGNIVSDYARGTVNQQFGLVSIEWGQMVSAAGNESEPWYDPADVVGGMIWKPRDVMPETLRYSTVVISNLPLNADILGLDPVRLPSDGRVPIYRAGDVVLIHNTKITALPSELINGQTYSVGRSNLADCYLIDSQGTRVPSNGYAVNLAAGTVTIAADFVMGDLDGPLSARHRIEELNLLADVQINGQITLAAPLSRDFDDDTLVSSALLFGDMFARVTNVFDQVTWTSVWSDSRIGADTAAAYNTIGFPIEVTNAGAVTERWRINFTSTTAFQIIGENIGVIGTGTTAADCSPVNPLTGEPYFTIQSEGWGAGWAVGNQLRFNTVGATAAIWMARTVLAGATLAGDSIDMQLRGDVDA